MVVIFSLTKPFTDNAYIEQMNAILSWKQLEFPPHAGSKKIILCGNENEVENIETICRVFDIIHHSNIQTNLSSMFQVAYTYTESDDEPVLYINNRIILDSTIVKTWDTFSQIVSQIPPRYLLYGDRHDWLNSLQPFEEFRYGQCRSLNLDSYITH